LSVGLIELPEAEARVFAQGFDLGRLDRAFLDDPFPRYHALRRFAPVKRLPDGSVFLSRYADVALCYRDNRMSSDKKAEFGPKFGTGTPIYRHHTTSLVFNDPPLHTRVRPAAGGGLHAAGAGGNAGAYRGDRGFAARHGGQARAHGLDRGFRLPPARRGDLRHAGRAGR
jgi:hypothetical protein